jgi:hypothetical protein
MVILFIMKKKSWLKYILILPFVLIGIFIYWYLNPTNENLDFHLQHLLSDPQKNFYKERNLNFNKEKYTYNNEIYTNSIEKYKLIIHSIDFTEFGEKILIITDYFNNNVREVNLTYKNKNGTYTPVEIIKSNDTIFIYQLSEIPNIHKYLIYKGYRINN